MAGPMARVHVSYGQSYVVSDPESFGLGLEEAFAGQSAGLCGAAVPGALWLTTGLHTGNVGFTVEVRGQAPPRSAADRGDRGLLARLCPSAIPASHTRITPEGRTLGPSRPGTGRSRAVG